MGNHDEPRRETDEPAVPRDGVRTTGRGLYRASYAQHSRRTWDEMLVAVVAVSVCVLSTAFAFAPSSIVTRTLQHRNAYRIAAAARGQRLPAMHMGLRGYKSFLRRGEGLNVRKPRADGQDEVAVQDGVQDDEEMQDDNGFDPFFVLSEGMLHAEPTAIVSWPPPMPSSVAEFEAQLAADEALRAYAFLPDPDLLENAITSEREEWINSWAKAKPQETIASDGLRRDRWVPLDIPMSSEGIGEMLQNPYVQLVLSDPQQRNYWIYATGRTLFFFGSSVFSALLQINIEPDWRPWVFGTNYRREMSAALKRIAMSGEAKNSGDFNSATKIPSIVRVFRLFGSVFELYRRDCSNIAFGIYRYPYDASLRHRQFNPFFVRERFTATFSESMQTGVRRKKGEKGKREVKQRILLREVQALGGVVLVEDPLKEPEDLFNDRYLLGNTSFFPDYYLQNFHWQTDGWLSTKSARAYEYTTESLFSGCQDAMQRQSFVSISEFVALRKGIVEEEDITLLDVAAGTGRQHTFLKDNWPKMETVCSDMSPFYLQEAYENMEYFAEYTKSVTGRDIVFPKFVQAKGEDLPFGDTSFDIILCTYLFHEIPFPVRKAVAAEMFRVVKPGGICVITDSFQRGDFPERDHIGKRFPANYHEPYYLSYFENTDLVKIFQACGFQFRRHQCAHLSKVLTFVKPDPLGDQFSSQTLATSAPEEDGERWALV